MVERGEPELVAVGNALVDVFAAVDEEVGPLLGLHPDRAAHVDYGRLSEILVALPDPAAGAGGGAANTAKLASALGIRAAFAGCLGSGPDGMPDRFAALFEGELREAGVVPVLARSRLPTGACAVIRMPGGSTAVAACPSAAAELEARHVPEELIRSAKVVVLDGFLLGRAKLVRHILDAAERYGTVIALDVGSAPIAAARAAEISGYCEKYPLILFMNQAEAEAFCCARRGAPGGSDCPDADEAEEVYAPLAAMTREDLFPIIVVKRGDKGALVFGGGDVHEARTAAEVPFDATGAGDAFAAGFLAAWIRSRSLSECADLGNRVAKEALRVPGTALDRNRLRRLTRFLR